MYLFIFLGAYYKRAPYFPDAHGPLQVGPEYMFMDAWTKTTRLTVCITAAIDELRYRTIILLLLKNVFI